MLQRAGVRHLTHLVHPAGAGVGKSQTATLDFGFLSWAVSFRILILGWGVGSCALGV